MNRLKKARIWLACKILGNTPLINNVTFYQTVCLDMDAGININGGGCNQKHELRWVGKCEGIGFKFDYYEDSINGTYDDRMKANLMCDFK